MFNGAVSLCRESVMQKILAVHRDHGVCCISAGFYEYRASDSSGHHAVTKEGTLSSTELLNMRVRHRMWRGGGTETCINAS